MGKQTAEEARKTGVISFFSCEPNQSSYEIEKLENGAFTYALLEGLTGQKPCITVEKLDKYLCERVPQLNREYKKGQQTPYTVIEPIAKNHLILLPNATPEDIEPLKREAAKAEDGYNLELAKQLWIRVGDASSGKDEDAVKALERIRMESSSSSSAPDNQNLPKPEVQPSKYQPTLIDKRKKSLLVTGGGIFTTLAVVSSGIYLKLQSKVPKCSSTEDLCKIFPQKGDGKEYRWFNDEQNYPTYKPPIAAYVSNDRECGGSSSPVLKLQYEFPDQKQPHSGWAVDWHDKNFDISKFSTLDFHIKRVSGNGKIQFGLKDENGKGDNSKVDKELKYNEWETISIPLSKFEEKIDKSKIWNINIDFLNPNFSGTSSGTICIDKIRLR